MDQRGFCLLITNLKNKFRFYCQSGSPILEIPAEKNCLACAGYSDDVVRKLFKSLANCCC